MILMAKERIYVDKTEIVAGVTMGDSAVRMSWTADQIQDITFMKMETKKLFKKVTTEMISIKKKGQPMGTPIMKTKADNAYWDGYKKQIEAFCEKNRVKLIDLTKGGAPVPPQA